MRSEYLCPSSPISSNTLTYLLDAFISLLLFSKYPALQHHGPSLKKWKPLLLCESEIGSRLHGHRLEFSPALIEHDGKGQDKSHTKGMPALLCQGECCADTLQRLIRIATQPQNPGGIHQARHPSVPPRAQGQGTMLLRLIEGDPTFQMGPGSGK